MPVSRLGKPNINKSRQKSGIPVRSQPTSRSNQTNKPDFAHNVTAAGGCKNKLPQRVPINGQATRKALLPFQSPAPERVVIRGKVPPSPAVRGNYFKNKVAPNKVPFSPAVRVLKIATPTPFRMPRKRVDNKKSIRWADETSPIVQDKLARHLFEESPQTKNPPTSILKSKKSFQQKSPIRIKSLSQDEEEECDIEIVAPTLLNTEVRSPVFPPLKKQLDQEISSPVKPTFVFEENKENLADTIQQIKKKSPARISNALTQQKVVAQKPVTQQNVVTQQNALPKMVNAEEVLKLMNQQLRKVRRKSVQNIFAGVITEFSANLNYCDVIKEDNEIEPIESDVLSKNDDVIEKCDDVIVKTDITVKNNILSPIVKKKIEPNLKTNINPPPKPDEKFQAKLDLSDEYFEVKLKELREQTRLELERGAILQNRATILLNSNPNKQARVKPNKNQTYHNILSQENQPSPTMVKQSVRNTSKILQPDQSKTEIPENSSNILSKSWDLELRKESNNNIEVIPKEILPTTSNKNNNNLVLPTTSQQASHNNNNEETQLKWSFNSSHHKDQTSFSSEKSLVFTSKLVFPQTKVSLTKKNVIVQPKPINKIKPPTQRFHMPKPKSSGMLKSRISQQYAKILLDDEVALLTCKIKRQLLTGQEKSNDPVAEVLDNGDLTHFIPIIPTPSATPQRPTKVKGSAFSSIPK